ncbi:MAG TPA: sulfotransferase [Egibacteraceae bacterium]|jgi:hypothetical protein|nr:sulfotransferase [Egibacteraceae bacterium]
MTAPRTLVYVAGSWHTGSTLLNLLLDGHSQISGLGEIHWLFVGVNTGKQPEHCACGRPLERWDVGSCSCGEALESCLRRRGITAELDELTGIPDAVRVLPTTDPLYLNRGGDGVCVHEGGPAGPVQPVNPNFNRVMMILGSRRLCDLGARFSSDVATNRAAVRNSLLLIEATRRATGTPIVVDTTKAPARMKGLYLYADERFLVLNLVRDGRAVCYSRMRREGVTMQEAAQNWKLDHFKYVLTRRTIPSSSETRVRYEELCRAPGAELTRICAALGVPFEEAMLDFRSADRHMVGGNPMRFRHQEAEIRLDERWKGELTADDLSTFERIAGRLNRRLGYS